MGREQILIVQGRADGNNKIYTCVCLPLHGYMLLDLFLVPVIFYFKQVQISHHLVDFHEIKIGTIFSFIQEEQ